MDQDFQEFFAGRWQKYFGATELPIGFFYSDEVRPEDAADSANEQRCLIGNLERVRRGRPYVYNLKTPSCPGGKRYCGFTDKLRPGFEHFLSCGIPGQLEGERYKKSPELVLEFLKVNPVPAAPAKNLVFKRWDRFAAAEEPLAAVFFAKPDVLAALFTLANYDLAAEAGVVAPMGAGCATIIHYPRREAAAERPRCVLGMMDISARPCVPAATLTFAASLKRLRQMAANMDESFLITKSWGAVRERL